MNRAILYINNTYCQSVEQLRDIMSNSQLVGKDSFRREILSSYRDGTLSKWFKERNTVLEVHSSSLLDDELFMKLYKIITKDNECPNIHSDFSNIGEFVRCEIGNKQYEIDHREITFEPTNEKESISFVFKSLQADNNTRVFTLKDKNTVIYKIEWNWNDKAKGKEHSFEIEIDLSKYEGKKLFLIEGSNNLLCTILIDTRESKTCTIGEESITFYYAKSIKQWVGRSLNSKEFSSFNTFTKRYSEYNLKFLTPKDIEKLTKEDANVWNKISLFNFWIVNKQYYEVSTNRINTPFMGIGHFHCIFKTNLPI